MTVAFRNHHYHSYHYDIINQITTEQYRMKSLWNKLFIITASILSLSIQIRFIFFFALIFSISLDCFQPFFPLWLNIETCRIKMWKKQNKTKRITKLQIELFLYQIESISVIILGFIEEIQNLFWNLRSKSAPKFTIGMTYF